MPEILSELVSACAWGPRLQVAVDAVTSAGAALEAFRGAQIRAQEVDSQLKTSIDLAAEGWVLGLLCGTFPDDAFLAEESFAASGAWTVRNQPFWTVDALDGTRSYVEGYDGYCVQVAYVVEGRPVLGVIAEPAANVCFIGVEGLGAYRMSAARSLTRLAPRQLEVLEEGSRFVDSTRPKGPVGELMAERRGAFVECGSVGLKACRVAEDAADVYAKAFRFRLWDVAPIEVLLSEAGCSVRLWTGARIDYSGEVIEFQNLLAAPSPLLPPLVERLSHV